MFGWFRPSCPCDSAAKRWVESRLRWLSGQFGLHLMLERPVILPTVEFFPDPYDATPGTARLLFRRVCGYMGVHPEAIQLAFFDDQTSTALLNLDPSQGIAAGTWGGAIESQGYGRANTGSWQSNLIRLERGTLDRPANLVGIMAHELSHQRLLGERRCNPENYDNELLTDLTAVYHGFGVFLANNSRRHFGELSYWPGTQLRRPEYLSEPMLGYALAHIAWFRDEDRPRWAKQLNWAPRAVFKQGLRYLQKTADSSFKPIRVEKPEPPEEDDLDRCPLDR